MEVRVDGLAELGEALKQFPEVLGKKYLRKATFLAAQVIEQDAITHAPVRTGNMKDAIAIFKRKDDPSTAHYAIGVRKIKLNRKMKNVFRIVRRAGMKLGIQGDAYYWRFVEFGTAKMPAHPFLRPAFEAQKMAAIEKFRTSLADGVQAAAKEVAKQQLTALP